MVSEGGELVMSQFSPLLPPQTTREISHAKQLLKPYIFTAVQCEWQTERILIPM